MANTKTAKANIKVNKRNYLRNLHFKSKLKTFLKKAVAALQTKADDRGEVIREALRVIDKTASKGVISKPAAARKKSKLTIALNKTLAS